MIITICNYKGGVGKTTTCHNLSIAKAIEGYNVLMIDLDPQASLTKATGTKISSNNPTIYELIIAECNNIDYHIEDIEDSIIHLKNVDIIPAKKELYNITLKSNTILKNILDKIKNKYDYIFIDCSPSKNLLNENALFSCDEVIIPVEANFLASEGLYEFIEDIKTLEIKYNIKIKICGIIITMYQKTNLGNTIKEFIKETINNKNITNQKIYNNNSSIKVFNDIIPRSIKVGEANIYNKSIIEYKPKNEVSKAYIKLANQI